MYDANEERKGRSNKKGKKSKKRMEMRPHKIPNPQQKHFMVEIAPIFVMVEKLDYKLVETLRCWFWAAG